jgi:hypothetical protein
MSQPPNRLRAAAVLAVVVSTIALGIVTNLLSDSLGSALASRRGWYLLTLATLLVIGVLAVLAYGSDDPAGHRSSEGAAPGEPKPDQPQHPGTDGIAAVGTNLRRLRVGRRPLLAGLAIAGVAAFGAIWQKNIKNLMRYGAWELAWISTDRIEFQGNYASFSPDGKAFLYSAPDWRSIAVRTVDSGAKFQFTWSDETFGTFPTFSGDGRFVASSHGVSEEYEESQTWIRIWSVESKELAQEIQVAKGSIAGRLRFNPAKSQIAAAIKTWTAEGDDYSFFVEVWDLDASERIASVALPDEPSHMTMSPDGEIVAVSSLDKRVHLFDASTLDELAVLTPPDEVDAICFSPDGSLLAASGPNGYEEAQWVTLIWEIESRTLIASMSRPSPLTGVAIAFHPDKQELAIGSWYRGSEIDEEVESTQREILLWDMVSDEASESIDISAETVTALRYSDEGTVIQGLMSTDYPSAAVWERWERLA